MSRRGVTVEQAEAVFVEWIHGMAATCGLVSSKGYTEWAKSHGKPSITTVAGRLSRTGRTSFQDVIEARFDYIVDLTGNALLRFPACKSQHPRVSEPVTAMQWRDRDADCEPCAENRHTRHLEHLKQHGTIEDAYPHLVRLLATPRSRLEPADYMVGWLHCHRLDADHPPVVLPPMAVATGQARCYQCDRLDELDQTGVLLPGRYYSPRSRQEEEIERELRRGWPHLDIFSGHRLIIGADEEITAGWIHPDLAFPHVRVVVEIDGGGPHSRHATHEGQQQDAYRDRAVASAGWHTVRWRAKDLPPLSDTPALLLHANTSSPRRAAAAIIEAIEQTRVDARGVGRGPVTTMDEQVGTWEHPQR